AARTAGPAELTPVVQAGRGKVASLVLHPVRFDPALRRCQWSERIRVGIEFVPSSGDLPLPGKGVVDGGRRRDAVGAPVVNAGDAAGWRCLPASSVPKSRASADTLPAKILVDRDGWCTVGYGDLAAGGIDPALVDPRTIKLFHGGNEIPLYFRGQEDGVFDPGDRFGFFGQRTRGSASHFHPFADANLYWLAWGGLPGGRMVDEEADPGAAGAEPALRFADTLHRETDSLFIRLKARLSDQSDRWFWRRIDEGQSTALALATPDIDPAAGGTATLRVKLHGFTYLDGDGDHRAVISLNGWTAADTVWDGQSPCLVTVNVPLSALVAGDNQLVLAHGPTPYAIDSYFLDWVELAYPRRYAAAAGYLEFSRPDASQDGLYRYTIEGMPGQNIAVYKPGISRLSGVTIGSMPSGAGYTAMFTDRTSGPVRYLAVLDDSLHEQRPLAVLRNRPSDLAAPGHRAEYLIVAPDTMEPQARQLAAVRAGSFDGVMVALTSDIYDEFGGGIASDVAIREFIRYAYAVYDVPPAYVVLMGGGSYDPKNLLGTSRPDLVPVHLSRTDDFGPVPDDDYFVRIAGDDFVADLSIGRLPLNSPADQQAWEAKRQGYEQEPATDQWHRDFLMIAGPPGNPLDDFYT
ncbi:hypothetical protein EG831_07440, partial [bacterium]|nr:hypothetical protein [bacterium]